MTERGVNILPIDLGYMGKKEAAGAFLVTQGQTRCLVESGPASCLKQLMAGLESAGLSVQDLNGLILTHIHLDHAGASGYLTSNDCHAYVHPRGARHLIDPERLNASALRVFGTRLESELGVMKPIKQSPRGFRWNVDLNRRSYVQGTGDSGTCQAPSRLDFEGRWEVTCVLW